MDRSEMLRRLRSGESALEVSIQKWQDIVDGESKNLGSNNCALCETSQGCSGCIIRGDCIIFLAKGTRCNGTPYEEYVKATTPEARHEAALQELEFLKSLRKEV